MVYSREPHVVAGCFRDTFGVGRKWLVCFGGPCNQAARADIAWSWLIAKGGFLAGAQ